jgi:hypothetical protein
VVCADNKVGFRFMVIEIICIVGINLLVLFASFYWVQRYSNSPGNVTWAFMFWGFAWNAAYANSMHLIGALALAITIITLLVNLVAGGTGITTGIKKAIIICWAICLVLMFIS